MNPNQEITKHRLSATMHLNARIKERLGRQASKLDVDKMRLAFIKNNKDCFMVEQNCDDSIIAIVRFQNLWTRAVFNKTLGVVVTVGV